MSQAEESNAIETPTEMVAGTPLDNALVKHGVEMVLSRPDRLSALLQRVINADALDLLPKSWATGYESL